VLIDRIKEFLDKIIIYSITHFGGAFYHTLLGIYDFLDKLSSRIQLKKLAGKGRLFPV